MSKREQDSIVRAGGGHAGARFMDVRNNPFGMDTMKKVALSAGAVGFGAAITMIGLAMLGDYVNTKWRKAPATGQTAESDGKVPVLTGYKRAAAMAVVGIVGATAAQSFSHGDDWQEIVAASVGIGGVASGVLGGYTTYKAAHPSSGAGVYAPVASRQAA